MYKLVFFCLVIRELNKSAYSSALFETLTLNRILDRLGKPRGFDRAQRLTPSLFPITTGQALGKANTESWQASPQTWLIKHFILRMLCDGLTAKTYKKA